MPVTYGELQRRIATAFKPHYDTDALREARYLLQAASGFDAVRLLSAQNESVPEPVVTLADNYLARRLNHEPLSRIVGWREFYGLRFALSPDTLDPRADSETVIAAALAWRAGRPDITHPHVVDLGTGSGALLLALLHEWKDASGVGVDLAAGAVETAMRNAESLGLSDRAAFQRGNWGEGLASGVFDVVLCNPPYIPSADIAGLESNVKKYDPILALDGGQDGLMSYRTLVHECRRLLTPTGAAFFEVGIGQAEDVSRLGVESGATQVVTHSDSGGILRVVDIRYGDN